ncbi:unnamed protein product [Mycena citricolor]|uniref:F-box domain-containing protein n=1 Tax=Mycena citricolor TaxID=2018698 RepID=A0AAD2HXI6_9AGAR|nr:unnamed protein product [Mycena citricolor]
MAVTNSPFLSRLGTNYVPSDGEIDAIHGLLAVPEAVMSRNMAEIEKLQERILQLQTEIQPLKSFADAHRALISPFRRLPIEIMQLVFVACLPTIHNALIDPAHAPLLLGRVCKHWRDVSRQTPRLWTSVHIPISHVTQSYDVALAPLVHIWLTRSGMLPLDISVTTVPYQTSLSNPLEGSKTILALLPFTRRMRQLHLCAFTEELAPILALGASAFPLLEDVAIHCPGSPGLLVAWDLHMFAAPRLHTVSLYVTMAQPAPTLSLPWASLTELNISCFRSERNDVSADSGLNQNQILSLLRLCSNLVRCSVRATVDEAFIGSKEAVGLPNLVLLHLCYHINFPEFLKHINAPRLAYLQVRHNTRDSWYEVLRTAIPPDSFTLVVQDYRINENVTLDLLTQFPKTTHLVIGTSISILEWHPELCPLLRDLTVSKCSLSDSSFCQLIRSRSPTLRRVKTTFTRLPRSDMFTSLQDLVDIGLNLELVFVDRNAEQATGFVSTRGIEFVAGY